MEFEGDQSASQNNNNLPSQQQNWRGRKNSARINMMDAVSMIKNQSVVEPSDNDQLTMDFNRTDYNRRNSTN